MTERKVACNPVRIRSCVMRLIMLGAWFSIASVQVLHAGDAGIARGAPSKDQLPPVTVSLLAPNNPAPVPGTDGKYHVSYELVLTNVLRAPATIQKISVVDMKNPSVDVATYEGAALLDGIRDPDNTKAAAADAVIAPNMLRLFLVDLVFAKQTD